MMTTKNNLVHAMVSINHNKTSISDQNGNCKMFLMRVNLGDVFTTPKNIENLTSLHVNLAV